jgi:pimeloyl-ACP methyl ester carboxylesterase
VRQDLWQFYFKGGEDFQRDPYNARQKLAETKIPILVISADHEICFPPENWFELNRKLPTTQIVVIPQTGHGVHHQYPNFVSSYIHSFIEHNKKLGFAN